MRLETHELFFSTFDGDITPTEENQVQFNFVLKGTDEVLYSKKFVGEDNNFSRLLFSWMYHLDKNNDIDALIQLIKTEPEKCLAEISDL